MTSTGKPEATDLGRRLAEQRDRAGLSVAETADRAGLSPGYLAYLEASPTPNPSQATLTRLAAALDVPLDALSGADMNLPPGQRGSGQSPVLRTLTTAECRSHLGAGGVGRFLFDEPGRGPVAIPVNYRMDGDDVIFRTSGQASILRGLTGVPVSFDVDHLDDALAEGWSVLMTGTARAITDTAELERVEALGVQPWAGGDRESWIRFTPTRTTGRSIRVTA